MQQDLPLQQSSYLKLFSIGSGAGVAAADNQLRESNFEKPCVDKMQNNSPAPTQQSANNLTQQENAIQKNEDVLNSLNDSQAQGKHHRKCDSQSSVQNTTDDSSSMRYPYHHHHHQRADSNSTTSQRLIQNIEYVPYYQYEADEPRSLSMPQKQQLPPSSASTAKLTSITTKRTASPSHPQHEREERLHMQMLRLEEQNCYLKIQYEKAQDEVLRLQKRVGVENSSFTQLLPLKESAVISGNQNNKQQPHSLTIVNQSFTPVNSGNLLAASATTKQADLSRLNSGFQRAQQRMSVAEKENSRLQQQLQEAEAEKRLYMQKWQRAVQKLKEEEKLKKRITELINANKELKQEAEEFKNKYVECNMELRVLRESEDNFKSTIDTRMSELAQKLLHEQQEREKLSIKNRELQGELDIMKQHCGGTPGLTLYQKTLQHAERGKGEMTQRLLAVNREVAEKSLRLEESDIEVKKLRAHNKILEQRCEKQAEELRGAKDKLFRRETTSQLAAQLQELERYAKGMNIVEVLAEEQVVKQLVEEIQELHTYDQNVFAMKKQSILYNLEIFLQKFAESIGMCTQLKTLCEEKIVRKGAVDDCSSTSNLMSTKHTEESRFCEYVAAPNQQQARTKSTTATKNTAIKEEQSHDKSPAVKKLTFSGVKSNTLNSTIKPSQHNPLPQAIADLLGADVVESDQTQLNRTAELVINSQNNQQTTSPLKNSTQMQRNTNNPSNKSLLNSSCSNNKLEELLRGQKVRVKGRNFSLSNSMSRETRSSQIIESLASMGMNQKVVDDVKKLLLVTSPQERARVRSLSTATGTQAQQQQNPFSQSQKLSELSSYYQDNQRSNTLFTQLHTMGDEGNTNSQASLRDQVVSVQLQKRFLELDQFGSKQEGGGDALSFLAASGAQSQTTKSGGSNKKQVCSKGVGRGGNTHLQNTNPNIANNNSNKGVESYAKQYQQRRRN